MVRGHPNPGHPDAVPLPCRCPLRACAGGSGPSTPPARCSPRPASRSSRPGWPGSADEAVKAAADLGGPLSVKIVSADILHKSDIGGVRLDVPADEDAVRAAYQAVTAAAPDGARVEGVLVSPMRRGGAELLVGVVPDPQWGPVLAVAIGGLFVEVLRDAALAPLPVTPGQAGRLLDRLRGRAVLDGVRGAAPADRDALTAVIARIGDLALALADDLNSLEVNPLLVDGARIEALDAVVTWREHCR